MPLRIALCGFSAFEFRAMQFSFQYPADPAAAGYDVVEALADADFAVVDADSKPAVKGVVQSGRVAQAVFVGSQAPDGAAVHLPRPIDPTRILRALDELIARRPRLERRQRPPEDAPRLDEMPAAAPALQPLQPQQSQQPLPEAPAALAAETAAESAADAPAALLPAESPAVPLVVPEPTLKAEKRAAARAAARRARLASDDDTGTPPVEPLHDVLVLDADAAAAAQLCTLLERFGFNCEVVDSITQASEQVATRAFAAVFLDITLDGSDNGAGLALLQRIHRIEPPAGHHAPAVLLLASTPRPADRVRASLAGVGTPLVKPLARGDVARALESRGVPFPADARRR